MASFVGVDREKYLRLALLGPLTIHVGDSELELTGPKRRALLVLLALHAGSPLSRDRIIEALWPGAKTGREESTLRVHISHLRDVLEPDRQDSPGTVLTRGSGYMLTADVDIDIARFDRLTREGRALLDVDPAAALSLLDQGLSLWRGRPLQDAEYEEFAQDEIRRLEMARSEAVENRAAALVAVGEVAAAVEDLEPMVRTNPTAELPTLLLMEALYRLGRQPDALRVATRHVRELGRSGLTPSPRLRDLEDRILRHDPTLLGDGQVTALDLAPGRAIRGYEIRGEAGAGAFGRVYRAFQASVGRQVALKVARPELAHQPEFIRSFAEEARLVAGLEHPHIVPLYDFWRDPGGAYLVMRWMEGGSLERRIGSPWPPHQLATTFAQLTEGLAYAHSAGVVHRDIKPANVLFDQAGNAYLADFGLATAGVGTPPGRDARQTPPRPPYASPEVIRGEPPSVASDVYSLGVLLAELASGRRFDPTEPDPGRDGFGEVIAVATAPDPGDRYPDATALRTALLEAAGSHSVSVPRRIRRNPYKGLAPFQEGDRADFYGRDDVAETLVHLVAGNGLVAVLGPSGSGKSSVVMAGLVPLLREGSVPGSDAWPVVHMVPGTDPFDEFQLAIRSVALAAGGITGDAHELRSRFEAALDGPSSGALLVVDQFEELFSPTVAEPIRQRFLDNLGDLATDPGHRVRVVVTLRADFADRPLAHPTFGDLIARASVLLPHMRPDQLEDVIRRPAARVGIEIEPGLVAEIIRDVSTASGYLPLLQYLLSELFERRTEDRLSVHAYRSLGGVQGVLERQAESAFRALAEEERRACRQLFLRLVQLGDHGEETRRRLPIDELRGMPGRGQLEAALEAFTSARILTFDRDPVSRTPTVEVSHETVIQRWSRYRVWIDEARSQLQAHRRVVTAASAWQDSGEHPSYLLGGGPLAAAIELAYGSEIALNETESRFVEESRRAEEAARLEEAARVQHEEEVEARSRRRLRAVIGAVLMLVVVGALATYALIERQRADRLAETQQRHNLARELAARAIRALDSSDHDLALLLAIASAEETRLADGGILPESVDALHMAVINPRPDIIVSGGGTALGGFLVEYSADGTRLLMLSDELGATVLDAATGDSIGSVGVTDSPAFGVAFHPGDHERLMTIHADGLRLWHWPTDTLELRIPHRNRVTTAAYSPNGSRVVLGDETGLLSVHDVRTGEILHRLDSGEGELVSVDFDPTGTSVVFAGSRSDGEAIPGWPLLVWDSADGTVTPIASLTLPALQAVWHPVHDKVAVTVHSGEIFLVDANTGSRLNSFGNAQFFSRSIDFTAPGHVLVTAGTDGIARVFGTEVGGEAAFELPTGGVPLRDAAIHPLGTEVTTLGVDGTLRIWRSLLRSELPARVPFLLGPYLVASADGTRYLHVGSSLPLGFPRDQPPRAEVIDAASGQVIAIRPGAIGFRRREPAISHDGALVAFTAPDNTVEVFEVDTMRSRTVSVPDTLSTSLAFTADAEFLIDGRDDGSIAVWKVAEAELVTSFPAHGERVTVSGQGAERLEGVTDVVVHPHHLTFYSGGVDGAVKEWKLADRTERILHTFNYEVHSMAMTPDGSQLVVGDTTGELVVVDVDSGDIIVVPERTPGRSKLVISPDGRTLAGGGPGPFVHLWDLETGRLIRRLQGSVYWPGGLGFVNGGTELRVAAGEGVERGYVLDPERLLQLAIEAVSREMSEAECLEYLHHPCR